MDQERRLSGSDYDIVGVPFVDSLVQRSRSYISLGINFSYST